MLPVRWVLWEPQKVVVSIRTSGPSIASSDMHGAEWKEDRTSTSKHRERGCRDGATGAQGSDWSPLGGVGGWALPQEQRPSEPDGHLRAEIPSQHRERE